MTVTRFTVSGRLTAFQVAYRQIRVVTGWEFREDLWQRVGGPLLEYMADQQILSFGWGEINS